MTCPVEGEVASFFIAKYIHVHVQSCKIRLWVVVDLHIQCTCMYMYIKDPDYTFSSQLSAQPAKKAVITILICLIGLSGFLLFPICFVRKRVYSHTALMPEILVHATCVSQRPSKPKQFCVQLHTVACEYTVHVHAHVTM